MSPPPRGARVVVVAAHDHPEVVEMVGKVGLVVEQTHAEAPDRAVVSFDGLAGFLGLVPHSCLGPYGDRPCLSLDPACCSLRPCEACIRLLREHLGASMQAATLTPDQAKKFVEVWNRLRSKTLEQMTETLRQAREFAERAASEAAARAPQPQPDPLPEPPETVPAIKNAKRRKQKEETHGGNESGSGSAG